MLKARKKITKREIKEDPLVTAYVRVQKFLQKHGKTINIGLAAVILLGGYIIIDSKNKKDNAMRAEKEIVTAEQIYFSKDYDSAINALIPIADKYKGTPAAGRAIFYIANAHYEKKNYSEAQKYYQQYLNDYGQIDYFKYSSLAGIAACLENEKQYEEAANMYKKAATASVENFCSPFYLSNAARCFVMAGQTEKGRTTYQGILDEYPDVAMKDEIVFHIESLYPS